MKVRQQAPRPEDEGSREPRASAPSEVKIPALPAGLPRWPRMETLIACAQVPPSPDWAAYLCERSLMAYDPYFLIKAKRSQSEAVLDNVAPEAEKLEIEMRLKREGAENFQRFEYVESFLGKLYLLALVILEALTVLALLLLFWQWFHGPLTRWFQLPLIGWPPRWASRLGIGVSACLMVGLLFSRNAYRAYGYTHSGRVVLVFRGTEPLWQLVLPDCVMIPSKCPMRHRGFVRAWERLGPEVTSWIKSVRNDKSTLVLTGHSLGGALAIVGAWDLSNQIEVEAVITFGSPRAFFLNFHRKYQAKPSGPGQAVGTLGGVTCRYTHATDLVSRIPPPVLHRHVGKEFNLHDSGAIAAGRPPYLIMRWSTSYRSLQKWLEPVNPSGYAVGLGQYTTTTATPRNEPVETLKQLIRWLLEQKWLLNVIMAGVTVGFVLGALVVALLSAALFDGAEHFCHKYLHAFEHNYSPKLDRP